MKIKYFVQNLLDRCKNTWIIHLPILSETSLTEAFCDLGSFKTSVTYQPQNIWHKVLQKFQRNVTIQHCQQL
jgi:hypothetical protein